jgi:uncharacterized protein HemY
MIIGASCRVISSTYDHWRLLSQAWTLAKEDEKAVPALTRAAGLSENGELDIILGQTYMNLEQWDAAVQALRTGISKGGLDRPDQAQVMLGQSFFNMNAFDEAREAFRLRRPIAAAANLPPSGSTTSTAKRTDRRGSARRSSSNHSAARSRTRTPRVKKTPGSPHSLAMLKY